METFSISRPPHKGPVSRACLIASQLCTSARNTRTRTLEEHVLGQTRGCHFERHIVRFDGL